ncbi:hypothetical protein SMACR_04921 [Sordaria macrospora]|uniref:WGS project CABT00000000 data, contig 2.1 n=2 Tax=Sordaria macrospora TaxID=5147 RepID=F7VM00_SORMK|nr:uncharacterized protein SMAC_04921 [Sordaria macrospora k-hell]KAA8630903.1 hypothetical protein SMACR_04921 [Sordaria macrospora]WPJ59496.1 hypothetical protein SMAC4_04921 [Sordaria macrospora]CCC06528.1 unnamed protein product [Sordaria macrospora k-hell]
MQLCWSQPNTCAANTVDGYVAMPSGPPMLPTMEYGPLQLTSSGSADFAEDIYGNHLYWGQVFPYDDEGSVTVTVTGSSYDDSPFGTAYSDQSSNIGSHQDLAIPEALDNPVPVELHPAEPDELRLSMLGGSLPVDPQLYVTSEDFDHDVSIDIQDANDTTTSDSTSSQLPASSGSSPFLQVPVISNSARPGKRRRIVKDIQSTNRVRELKSCSSCKLKKVGCSSPGTCTKCEDDCKKIRSRYAQQMCIRDPLTSIVKTLERWTSPDVKNRYWLGTDFYAQPGSSEHILSVSLSPDPNRAHFTMTGREFTSRSPRSMYNQAIRVDADPSPTRGDLDILKWMEEDIHARGGTSFRDRLEKFLLAFSDKFEGLPWGEAHPKARQVHTLMSNVVKMAFTQRIWATGGTQPFFNHNAPFTPPLMPVQAYLCLRAGGAISTFERTVLKAIQDLVDKQTIQKHEEPLLQSALFVSLWGSLWLMILVYHDSLTSLRRMAPANMTLTGNDRRAFEADTERLMHGIVVVYSVLFRNSATVVKCLKNASSEVFGNNSEVYDAFQEAWQSRCAFYRDLDNHPKRGQPSNERHLFFKLHVIEREAKLLTARRGRA